MGSPSSSRAPVSDFTGRTVPTAVSNQPLQLPQTSLREIDQPGRLYFGPHFCIRATHRDHFLAHSENSAYIPIEESLGQPDTAAQSICPTLYSTTHLHLDTLRISYHSELISPSGNQPFQLQFEYSATAHGTISFYWHVREQRQDAISPVPQYIPTVQTLPVSHCPMEAGNHRYVDLSFDFGEFNQLWWQDLIKADNVPRKSCVMPHATTKIPRHKTEARISTVSTDHNYRDIHLQHDHTTSETVYSPTNASCSTPAVQPIPLSSGGQEPGIPLVIFFKSEAKDVPVPDGVIYHLWLGIPSSPPVDSPSPQPLSSDIRNPEGRPHRCPLLPRVTHVKQKVIVDGHRYITQEIFGIGEGQTTEGVLSSPSTAEAPPGQPLANDIPSISQEVTGLNITSRYSAEPFREMEPTLVSSTMQFPQQSVTYTNRSQDNENEYARECVICLTNPRTVVLLPCRHMCACLPCAEALEAQSRQCPVCRLEFSTLLFLVTLSSTGE